MSFMFFLALLLLLLKAPLLLGFLHLTTDNFPLYFHLLVLRTELQPLQNNLCCVFIAALLS